MAEFQHNLGELIQEYDNGNYFKLDLAYQKSLEKFKQ